MKKRDFSQLAQLLLTPVLVMLLGLVLLLNPDFASALIARILGWVLLAVGAGFALSALLSRYDLAGKLISALVCLALGGSLLRNPLGLAYGIGRITGLLLVVRGVQDTARAAQWNCRMTYPVLTAAAGVLLILLPMTTSRLVLGAVGLVLLVLGAAMAWDRLRGRPREPGDDNIIDAL